MQDLAAIFETIPDATWWAFAGSFALAGMAAVFPIIQRRYYHLARRMQEPAGMMAWEYAEFDRAIGEYLDEVDWLKTLRAGMMAGGYLGGTIWIADLGHDGWQAIGAAVLLALGAIYSLWRRINDPPEAGVQPIGGSTEIPTEAITAIVSALGIVALIVLLIVFVTPQ